MQEGREGRNSHREREGTGKDALYRGEGVLGTGSPNWSFFNSRVLGKWGRPQ